MNELGGQTSPYLLQHKDNPVDWRVWAPEAFALAKEQDKPILLSVGYAACHWCHVMAAESFENEETAALMNDLFVPIKVDREERPDIDAIYQNALSLMGQSGGWPLTMFLTPDGEPFWGGTYFPPEPKYGRPAFTDLMQRVAGVYKGRTNALTQNTKVLRDGLERLSSSATQEDPLTPELLDAMTKRIADLVDPVDGGIGQAPKFPQSPAMAFLWRGSKGNGREAWGEAVLLTLERMAQGGIYDHLGGGYARYSTDNAWLVPHFEKMLYDNGQLLELLSWAWQQTGNPLFAERVAETIGWMLREMRVEDAAFAAALDADSEHEEGKFYVWHMGEVDALLGDDARLFKSHYDVNRFGNWEGKCILNRTDKPQRMDEATEARLAACRAILLKARGRRVRPGRDHKVLADWNGLAISGLCLAAGTFDRPDWLDAARAAFAFIDERMAAPDGRLLHSWCDGQTHAGMLDDHAAMIRAALALYQATSEPAYLAAAERWAEMVEAHFIDAARGGYYMSASDASDLITRLRNAHDHATPSGNGMMVEALASLFYLTGKRDYEERVGRLIGAFVGDAMREPVQHAAFLSGVDFYLNAAQIALFAGEGQAQMLRALHGVNVPNRTVHLLEGDAQLPAGHPAAGKNRIGAAATAYVCANQTCSLPITDPDALRETLAAAARHGWGYAGG
jgi:uncharacterized protein YyaL (SSP411 family)